ncbi:zinc ABC transporter substrate-binding protein [Bacillus sp. AGMB 02131]|uniref:Zinc ABC transporter substrate-binding protein n=1 Tax=Peribacillus faecalis TaxID=2772559 RepID=A0A927CZH1_9BACI|nr:zinc ABC transporter substrate-binding protein [Peribacillus faecalis]MBD3110548.1 zinc ABC transporter substrate-binding protein [Peribacillus faecalis]
MNKKLLLSFLLIFAAFLTACGNSDTTKDHANSDDALTIYTTVYPLQFLAEEIGGEYANVETVYPPGSNEHTYEPSQKDIVSMAESDLFLYIGYNLEGFVNNAKSILEDEDVPVIAVGELATEDHEHAVEEDANHDHATEEDTDHDHDSEEASTDEHHAHGDVDPHVWLDPEIMIHMAEAVKDELATLKPEQEEYFEKNYEEIKTKLGALDQEFADTIENSPKKKIIVSHSAYGYWEERYGLEQISVTGLTNSSEPSQKELQNIMKIAEENDIHYVIFEQNIDSKLTTIIQEEIGAESLTLHNLSVLTDKDIAEGRDYFSIMEDNLKTLKTALK